jgi:hypothetical protein
MRFVLLLIFVLGIADALPADQQASSTEAGVDPALVRQALAAFYKEHADLPNDGAGPWIELIGKAGGPAELRKLCDQLNAEQFSDEATVRAVDALAEAARARHARPTPNAEADPILDPDYKTLTRLLYSTEPKMQAAAARLAGGWKMTGLGNRVAELVASPDELARNAAFEALRQIGGDAALNFFAQLTSPDQRLEIRRRALVAIAEIKLDAAVMKAADVLPAIENEAEALETWRGLLKIEGAPQAFATRLPRPLPRPVVVAGLHAAGELGKEGEPLSKALARLVTKRGDTPRP